MKWTEQRIEQAQRKADLRAEWYRRHQEAVRAGTQPRARFEGRQDLQPYTDRLRLTNAWFTWVGNGRLCGPDGVEVRIWIRFAGKDLPFGYPPGDRERERPVSRDDYAVCVRRLPAGPVKTVHSFGNETSARWYAIGLAAHVREAGITVPRSAGIPAGSFPHSGLEDVAGAALVGAGYELVRGGLWLPRRVRAGWRRLRTGRRYT
jgi:hypothetical protein